MAVEYIIGKGAFVREVCWILKKTNELSELKGILQDDPEEEEINGIEVFEASNYYDKEISAVVAIGEPKMREHIAARFKKAVWKNIIDPSAQIGWNVELGSGCIICANCVLTCDIQISNHVQLNLATTVGHDTRIADFVTTAPGVHVNGKNTISSHVYFGSNSVTKEKINIASGVTIGMGAVVTRSIEEKDGVYVGNPAKKLR